MDWDTNVKQKRKIKCRIEKYIDSGRFFRENGLTPEEIYLEKERLCDVLELVEYIRSILTEKQFDILWLHAVENKTQEQIAKKYDVSQPAIKQNLTTIKNKLYKNLIILGEKRIYYVDLFTPKESTLEIGKPKIKIAYPSDYLMCVDAGGYYEPNGKYSPDIQCLIPEYLGQQYNGEKIYCTKCVDRLGKSKCTRLKKKVKPK